MSEVLTGAEVAAVRRPYRSATQMPARVFHDPGVFAFERERWFAREWLCVGRAEDAAAPGEYFLAEPAGESVIVLRGGDGVLRAFYNVCRHRGSRLLEEACGAVAKIHCPYHAWIYELDGALRTARHTEGLEGFDRGEYGLRAVRCEVWQGFVFVCLDAGAPALTTVLGDLGAHLGRFDLGALRRVRQMSYDVAANWKVIGENYSECYHCPGVHPQLNRLSRYDTGADYAAEGAWKGGYMELSDGVETLSTSGLRHGRPALPGMTKQDTRRVHYYLLWPNLLLSLHPDYLLTHQVWSVEPGRSTVHCDWYFPAGADSDQEDVVDFWDLTNRQDWHVCELQQRGTASRGYTPGRYSDQEDAVHAFDLMCVDRYAMDGVTSRRDSRGILVTATG
jgi:Rieske 2Fe-2S family protein